jgi:hypothetical protein
VIRNRRHEWTVEIRPNWAFWEATSARTITGVTEQHTITELHDENTALAYDAMRELRPHLTSAEDFTSAVRIQRKEGYRLAASLDPAGRVAAVAGFRHAPARRPPALPEFRLRHPGAALQQDVLRRAD